jgi:hypothetical protein
MTDVYVSAFYYTSGDNWASRGSPAYIASVPAGSIQTFNGLSIPIQAGDSIGFYAETGNINASRTSGAGVWYKPSNMTSTGETNYIFLADYTHAIAGFSISNTVNIELSRNNGSSWETLFTGTDNDGSEDWNVDGATTSQALIRLTSVADDSEFDRSDAVFNIVNPSAMHIASITMKSSTVSYFNSYAGSYVYATASVKVVDQDGIPVPGARVYGVWSISTRDSDNGLTNLAGLVSLNSDRVTKRTNFPRVFTFTVTNIVLDGYTYDSASNARTSGIISVR